MPSGVLNQSWKIKGLLHSLCARPGWERIARCKEEPVTGACTNRAGEGMLQRLQLLCWGLTGCILRAVESNLACLLLLCFPTPVPLLCCACWRAHPSPSSLFLLSPPLPAKQTFSPDCLPCWKPRSQPHGLGCRGSASPRGGFRTEKLG